MTDIPYSFVPGTKAKAQEVNANFIALANSVDENQSSANSRLSTLEEDVFALQTKKYVDFNTFTNSVLEAPNGVVENSSSYLTVKSGLRLLIANGKNDDGTLKNIDFTNDSEIIFDISNYTDGEKLLFIDTNGSLFTTNPRLYFVSKNAPSNPTSDDYVWFNIAENVMKRYNTVSGSWDDINAIMLADITISSGQITSVNNCDVVSFYKRDDKKEIIDYHCLTNRFLDIAMGASGTQYVAPANGILYWQGVASSNSSWFVMTNVNSSLQTKSLGTAANNTMCCHIPVAKNDSVKIDYTSLRVANVFRFVYEKGEVY